MNAMHDESVEHTARLSSRAWLMIAVVVVATGIAMFMVPEQKEQPTPIPLPPAKDVPLEPPSSLDTAQPVSKRPQRPSVLNTDVTSTEEREMPATTPNQDTRPQPVVPVVNGPEGEAARAFLRKQPSLPALLAQARMFQQRGQLGDAWLLYFMAARQGSAQAAMILAEQADPAYFSPQASLLSTPDLVFAHKWYAQAQRYGASEAGERLQKLYEYAKARAEQGDERAMLLVRQWAKN